MIIALLFVFVQGCLSQQTVRNGSMITIMGMTMQKGSIFRRPGFNQEFILYGNRMLTGGVFNMIAKPSNKSCGISSSTHEFSNAMHEFKCDGRNLNTIRILDKHGKDKIPIVYNSMYKFRPININNDCWASSSIAMTCTKQPGKTNTELYGWYILNVKLINK